MKSIAGYTKGTELSLAETRQLTPNEYVWITWKSTATRGVLADGAFLVVSVDLPADEFTIKDAHDVEEFWPMDGQMDDSKVTYYKAIKK